MSCDWFWACLVIRVSRLLKPVNRWICWVDDGWVGLFGILGVARGEPTGVPRIGSG